jgi:solute carrier family 25 citrate transporter 1
LCILNSKVANICLIGPVQATRFGVFQVIPAEWRRDPIGAAASGAFAGGVSVILFQGVDVVKSRMQGLNAARYKSTFDCFTSIVRDEGILALYKGVGPRMTRVCLEVAITMTLFGEISKGLDKHWKTG